MLRLTTIILILLGLFAAGCGSEKSEPASQAQPQTQAQAQPPAQTQPQGEKPSQTLPQPKSQPPAQTGAQAMRPPEQFPTDLKMNPSGVRYQDMTVGFGKEVVHGTNVEFDYTFWTADPTGLNKVSAINTSIGRPGKSYKGQVGVHPLPGLSDGLIGMKLGGSRRIYVPWQLGFPADESGGPYAKVNLIYEVVGIKEIPAEAVAQFQDSLAWRVKTITRIQDSIQQARKDSLKALGLDSLERPLTPIKDTN